LHQGSVLIVEDDSALRHAVARTLIDLGFEVREASNREIALNELRNRAAEVVLLDLNLPGSPGLQTASRMRSLYPGLGLIVLTVRDGEKDRIQALDAGADDYVTKPIRLPELAARIRAMVRRGRTLAEEAPKRIHIGEVSLDRRGRRVTRGDQEVHLTPKEFELLHVLMQHAGSPISHHKLLSTVWGPEYGNEREYLRTYISQLRRKLEADPSSPRYLLTENYIGYRFHSSAN
jgi:two-component system KDP operon response regulator KdpE